MVIERDSIILPFAEYELGEFLGSGSYGSVFEMNHPERGEYAVKILDFSKENLDSLIAYETKLEQIIGMSGNPYFVNVYEYETVELDTCYRCFVRMELLRSFVDVYDYRELTEEDIIAIAINLCDALAVCEQKGIIHRDLKPGNILVDQDGTCKLADFDAMKNSEDLDNQNDIKGTPAYMAPELFHGREYDHRVDIYALGMILYILLNDGREPFINLNQKFYLKKDREAAFHQRMEGNAPVSPAHASEKLAKIIQKALAFDPKDRYKNIGQMKLDLQRLSGEEKRSKKGLLIAVIPVLLLITLGFGHLHHKPETDYTPIQKAGVLKVAVVNGDHSRYKRSTVEAVCEELGLSCEIINIDQDERYDIVKEQEADCMFGSINDGSGLSFSAVVFRSDLKLVMKRTDKETYMDDIAYHNNIYEAMKDKSFALKRGSKAYSFYENVEEWKESEIHIVDTSKAAQQMVSDHKADLTILNVKNKVRYNNLTSISVRDLHFQTAFGCEGDGELLEKINQAIENLSDDGTLDRIAKENGLDR